LTCAEQIKNESLAINAFANAAATVLITAALKAGDN
jgi:hypothetical protein